MLESSLQAIKNSTDENAVQFGNLSFRSLKDCDAWLELHAPVNAPRNNTGLLVGFHTVMEHIYVQISGQDILKKLEQVIN